MNKKTKTTLAILAFVAFMLVSVFAYNNIAKKNKPSNAIDLAASSISSQSQSSSASPTAAESASQSESSSEQDRFLAPDFTVEDSSGKSVKLSDLRGKPVVLNFWASWCPPCKAEMPDFEKVYADVGDEVSFMMVDLVGDRETKEDGAEFIKEQGFTFPVYFDVAGEGAMNYGITSIPTTLLIDAEGYIVTGSQGMIDEESLRKGIELLKQMPTDTEKTEDKPMNAEYHKITQEKAKEMLEQDKNIVLLDVRAQSEYDEGHIEGAIVLPDTEIAARAEDELTDKDAVILVYCRSGRRSLGAANALVELGYTNVYDFGGILDWPYEVVK